MKNEWFDENLVEEKYPGATMIPPMNISQLHTKDPNLLSKICTGGEYFANIKKDGAMYTYNKGTAGKSYLFSRTTSAVTGLLVEKSENVPHIISFLDSFIPDGTVLVGEIYFHGGTSKDVTSIMGCAPKKAIERQKDNLIHYYIHDILEYNGESLLTLGAEDRYLKLKNIFKDIDLPEYIELAGYYDSADTDLGILADKLISEGEEGLVLKKKNGLYEPGKRPAKTMIKLKRHDTVDVVAMKAISATREYTGKDLKNWEYCIDNITEERFVGKYEDLFDKFPNIIAVTKAYYYNNYTSMNIGAYDDNNRLIQIGSVSSGFTDEDREMLPSYEGKVLELGVMQIDSNNLSLRHPIFVKVRDDKNAYDCKIKEIFN